MKAKNSVSLWSLVALLTAAFHLPICAQDDLYYDPDRDMRSRPTQRQDESLVTRRYEDTESGYDDEYYDYEDDYAYEYASRIRRFHRPVTVVDYYDPFFVDLYFYDPFFLPGASIYTWGNNDYWTWRRWNRWNRFNNWGWNNPYAGWGWNSWNYGPGWGGNWGWNSWNAWNNTYVFNNYYYDPYWTWNGCNPYYGNNWNGHHFNNNTGGNNGYTPRTYTGVRRGGTTIKTDGYARINDNGRIVDKGDRNVPTIELQPKNNGRQIDSDREPLRADDRNAVPARENRKPPATRGNDSPTRETPATRPNREPAREVRPRTETPAARPGDDAPNRPSYDRPTREERPARPSYDRPATEERSSRPSYDRPATEERSSRPSYDRPATEERSSRPSYDRPSGGSDRPSRSGGDTPSRNNSPSGNSGSKNAPSGRGGRN